MTSPSTPIAEQFDAIAARLRELEREKTHCPICGLDLRGATWCSLQKPGCPLPDHPPSPDA